MLIRLCCTAVGSDGAVVVQDDTYLFYAFRAKGIAVPKWLTDTYPAIDVHRPNSSGMTVFVSACEDGNLEAAQWLLSTFNMNAFIESEVRVLCLAMFAVDST